MSTPQPEAPKPLEVARANQHDIKIRWKGGREIIYPARFLRMQCPCAVCVDEMTGRRTLQESTVPQDVYPTGIDPVGHYAIQIYWSDGHSSGLYTWERLYELADKVPPS